MRIRFYNEADGWTTEGRKITDTETMETIRQVIESEGPVIIEHWFYRGSCAPDRLVFDDFESLNEYLTEHASAGDSIHVWNYEAVCRENNKLVHGKCPDDEGRIPERGAY